MNAARWARLGPATRRVAVMLVLIAAGLLAGRAAGQDRVTDLVTGDGYSLAVTTLLAIGLYSSTHGIDARLLRGELTVVVLAVTVGVLLKAALITAGMALLYPHPEALVLGVAVAQIDPLSVAALERFSTLSPRGRTLLLAWASFDDPMTTLLTVYAATLALRMDGGMDGGHTAAGPSALTGGTSTFLSSLALNLAFAAAVAALWYGGRHLRDRFGGPAPAGGVSFTAGCVLLAAGLAVAVGQFWMLGVALVGLFLRPALERAQELFPAALRAVTQTAFLVATLALGVVLATGVRYWLGLWLGLITFAAQVLVSIPLTRGRPRDDRVQLALAQQNGITAIVLALLLEPMFDGVVATVAPAILVINLLHLGGNALYKADTRALPVLRAVRGPNRPDSRPAGGDGNPDGRQLGRLLPPDT